MDRAQGCWDSKRRLDALGTVAPVIVSIIPLGLLGEGSSAEGSRRPKSPWHKCLSTWMERWQQPSAINSNTNRGHVGADSSRAGRASHDSLSTIRSQVSALARDGVEPVKKDGWGEGRICLGNVQPAHVSTRLGWAGRPFHRIRKTVLNWAEGHPDDEDGPLIGDEVGWVACGA